MSKHSEQETLQLELSRERYALSSLLDFARTLTPDLGVGGILKSVIRTIMGKALIKDALAYGEDESMRLRLLQQKGFHSLSLPDSAQESELRQLFAAHEHEIPLVLAIESGDDENGVYLLGFGRSMLPNPTIFEEKAFLESLSRLAGMAISNARLFESERERERLESELRLAREIQLSLFPQTLPNISGLEIAAHSRQSELVGGDYYDVIAISETEVLLAIADVVGKGVSAALIMSNLQAGLRALVSLIRSGQLSLLDATKELNRLLFESTTAERFVTAVFIMIDTRKMRIEAITCGHPKPIIQRNDGDLIELPTSGIPLGIIATFPYQCYSERLRDGDALILYTDGLSESTTRGTSTQLGSSGICGILGKEVRPDQNASEILSILVREETLDLHDDVTVVVARMATN
jgi:sigma-B regulation protein RsbU (phosphoserine phosphatase)